MTDESSRLAQMRARLEYLEEVNRCTLEALDIVASLGDFQASIKEQRTPPEILAETRNRLKQLIPFEATAFFTIDDSDNSFVLADWEPDEYYQLFRKEADRLIEEGTFAWAVNQNRAVMVPSKYEGKSLTIHVLSTKSRILGMFIGTLTDDGRNIYDSSLSLLSIVLLNSANTLESSGLYKVINDYNLSLEDTIRERTKELELARVQAEEANRAKGEFLSNMNHELRSPLNAIIGFSDVLLMESQNQKIQLLATKIKDSGKYLAHLIEDLLDFDHIEEGNIYLDIQEVSLNDLVASVVEARLIQLPKDFSLQFSLDPNCGRILCDPTRIKQILMNLLDNAVNYSPKGGVIWVRTRAQREEVEVSVHDQGIGIPPSEQETIFDRFRQLEEGYTRRAGGLGIGLSLIRQLLKLHRGRIWVESDVGKGAIFTFALPRPLADNRSDVDEGGKGAAGHSESHEPWSGRTVLLVDDVDHFHETMKTLFRKAGRVLSAFNGEEALEAASRERPDLIMMDLRMPVLDGFEAIKRLKTDPTTKDIPVVAVSAQAMKEDQERSFQLGADEFVTKPIDPDHFRQAIGRIFPFPV